MAMDIDTALNELLLTRPVTENDIVRAYRRMAIRFHPDKAADPDEKRWVQKKFVQVQDAYEFLKGLPIDAINAFPDSEVSQEISEGSGKQPETSKTCPFCAQKIQPEAIKCRFCGRLLEPVRTQQPSHEGPHSSHSSARWAGKVLFLCFRPLSQCFIKVLLLCFCFAIGFVGFPLMMIFMILPVSEPQRLSGSPVLPTKETPDLSWDAENAAAAKEFQQTFGRLLRIAQGPNGRCLAYFERIDQPVHNDQRIHGFWIHVLPSYVIFFKEHGSGTGTCRVSQ